MQRHIEATSSDAAARPLPLMNVPPCTEPLPEPPAPLPDPPLVTAVEQVVPKRTLAVVRTWMRRLRRCLRAAARGDISMAKRLRPQDLWLSAESNSMPLTAAWNWDLRPLLVGEPAVPLPVSSGDGERPRTSLFLDVIAATSSSFADQAIVSEMMNGMRDDSNCERGTLLCAPHGSALAHYAVADAKISKSVTEGWASGGWQLPCWPIRTYPYGIVDETERAGEPKFRLTSDLSWPPPGSMPDGEGGYVSSVNGAMDRSRWHANRLIRVEEVAEAAAIHESSGELVELWGLDCKSYYRAFGRQLSELWRNALVALDGFQLDERCCFGSAADAHKCSRASNYLAWRVRRALLAVDAAYPSRSERVRAWQRQRQAAGEAAGASADEIAERWTALFSFGLYIDDGAASSVSDAVFRADGQPLLRDGVPVRRATLHFEAACAALAEVGHVSEPRKEQPPSQKLSVLGVHISLIDRRMRLLASKRTKYAARTRAVAARSTVTHAELLALLGRLQFAAACYPRGRQWLHAPWRAARARYRTASGEVVISSAVRVALLNWASELEAPGHEGVPLCSRAMGAVGEPGVGAVYADASGSIGYMAWTVSDDTLLYVVGEWTAVERDTLSIAEKELIASTLGLVTLSPAADLSSVYSFTDNVEAQAAMRERKPSSAALHAVSAWRSEWLLASGVLEASERITSKANLWADLGSRGGLDEVVAQAAALNLTAREVLVSSEWSDCAARAVQVVQQAEASLLSPCSTVLTPSCHL